MTTRGRWWQAASARAGASDLSMPSRLSNEVTGCIAGEAWHRLAGYPYEEPGRGETSSTTAAADASRMGPMSSARSMPDTTIAGPDRLPGPRRAQRLYGTADATPLFVMLLGQMRQWGRRSEFARNL